MHAGRHSGTRPRAADLESIVTDRGYGFRDPRFARPRNDDSGVILLPRKLQAHLAIAFRVVPPPFPHLDEEKEVRRLLDRGGDVGARRRADRLDRLAVLAEHDLALALALDIDRLLDAHRTVLELLPDFGFDCRPVRQFLV